MLKRTIKVKFVDCIEDGKSRGSGGAANTKENNKIRELLKRMYVLDEESNEPDYVFTYVPVGGGEGFEYSKYKDAVLIFVQNENVFPDFYCFDYVIGLDHELQYGDRYFQISVMATDPAWRKYNDMLICKNQEVENYLVERGFCAMTVSNGTDAAKERERFFRLLCKYKRVDSGGRFLNNVGGPVVDRWAFEANHKFVIAFDNVENGIVQGDKIGVALAAKTIPIYWGNPNVTDIYNEKAFVNCHAFNSFEDVVEKIREIDNDDELYLSMLREPAFVGEAKTLEQWDDELSEFLRGIIEQPKEKAIKRRSENWMGIMQKMRVDGFKRLYHKRQIIRGLHAVYSPLEKATSDMQSIQKLKKTIKHGLGLS